MRKFLAALLAVIVGAGIFCACGKKAEPASSAAQSAQEPMTISIGFWNVQDYLQNDALQQYVEQKFHVRFTPVAFNYDDYPQRLQQMAASDALPDVFASDIYGLSAYESWISHGKIRALPKDLSAYPQLAAYLEQPYAERFMRADGRFYAIPRMTYSDEAHWVIDRCIVARKDWMQTLGLSQPQSWDEFKALLHAFSKDDPDGNGADDTGGLIPVNLNTLEALYLGLFPELSNTERGWMYENEAWIPVYLSQKTGAALEQVRGLYQEGLLEADFAYQSTDEAMDAFIDGEVGAIAGQYIGVVKRMRDRGFTDAQIQERLCFIEPWPAPDGNRYRFTSSLHWSESYFGSNVSDEKMETILALYEWLLSPEFALVRDYGVPQVDFTQDAQGGVHPVPQAASPVEKYPSLSILGVLAQWDQDSLYDQTQGNYLNHGEENIEAARAFLAWAQENTQRVNYNYSIIFMSTPAKNSLVSNRDVQNEMVKVILGEENAETAWPKVLERLYEATPLRQAVQEVTAEAAELGISP